MDTAILGSIKTTLAEKLSSDVNKHVFSKLVTDWDDYYKKRMINSKHNKARKLRFLAKNKKR